MNPLTARLSGFLLSETLGVFLCAIACFLLVDVLERRSWLTSFLLGAVCVALLLTSPAVIFLAFAIFLIAFVAALLPSQLKVAVALVLGSVLVMLPWQTHCFRATGGICYRVYATDPLRIAAAETDDTNLVYQWLRTWSLGERHIHVLHRNNPGAAPDWAFSTPADRDLFPAPEERLRDGLSDEQSLAISEDLASKSGQIRLYALTIARSASLWLDMQQNGHAQMDYVFPFGFLRVLSVDDYRQRLMRFAKMGFSSLVYLLYISIPMLFLFVVWRSRLSPEWLVHAFFAAVVLYTLITAYTAHNESRRNVVFLPAMVLAIAVGMHGRARAFRLSTATPTRATTD
jgi:hypothetical protein